MEHSTKKSTQVVVFISKNRQELNEKSFVSELLKFQKKPKK